jgi:exodeoxyribonuclease-3
MERIMRIVTWNVNGLRAALNKGVADWWQDLAPDVLCLQEIKAIPEQLSAAQHAAFEGAEAIWNPAQRKGYSGVATFLWTESLSNQRGLGEERFDIEGRVIQTRFADFTLFNIYFPNGQRDHGRLQYKLNFYAHLLKICDKMHARGEQIIITGDFNTAHQEIDLRNPKQNEKNSGFMPIERDWIDKYLEHGFVDVFRHLYPEREQYTWWTYRANARARNVGWRLDYYLVSESLVERVQDVEVYDDILGSDHCPVGLTIL